MRRAAVALGVVLLLILAALFALRGPLSLRLVDRALARNLASDPIAALPDGLHVVLCGAGGPLPDPVRSGPCVAIVAGRTVFVVDAGTGGARNLARLGVPPGRIAATLLTHFHSDHIDGLGELALQRWVNGTHREPMPVYGPPGVEAVVDGFDRAYRADAGYRVAHHGEAVVPPTGAGMVARNFREPRPGAPTPVWDEAGIRITAFRVEHEPVSPAVGYRFDYGGRSAVVSGDTKRSDELLRNAEGVDLLVHEALSPLLVGRIEAAAREAGNASLAKIAADIPDYHTSPVEVAELAAAAGAGHVLLYHIVPPLPIPGLDQVFLEGVGDAYRGGVTLGVDGSRVSLPRGSRAIEVSD